MIKKLWIKWFGQTSYCRWNHVAYSTADSVYWRCECGHTYAKKPCDDYLGPM